jgi:hypothetical protein
MTRPALRLFTTSGYQSKPSDGELARLQRVCLSCRAAFDSAWAGERICPRCKGTTAWRNGASVSTNNSGQSHARSGRKGSS